MKNWIQMIGTNVGAYVYLWLSTKLRQLHRERSGAGVAEYAMVIGLAVIVGVVALGLFWDDVEELFGRIGELIQSEIFGRDG